MGKKQETVEDVPWGNTVAMVGLDQFITVAIVAMVAVSPVCVLLGRVQWKVASDSPSLLKV